MPTPPATPPTWEWVAKTPLSMTATRTPLPVRSARNMSAEQLGEGAAFGLQFHRRAFFNDSVSAEDEHAIRRGGERQPMRDEQRRSVAHHAFVSFEHMPLGNGI